METPGDFTRDLYVSLCEKVGSEYSRSALEAHRLGMPAALPLASEYDSVRSFQEDYLLYTYLRKFKSPQADIEALSEKALAGFLACELQNAETNKRFRFSLHESGVHSIFHAAQRKIREILGPLRMEAVLRYCDWGPGGTATLVRAKANPGSKTIERRLSVTPGCLSYARAWLENDPSWMSARLNSYRPKGFKPQGESKEQYLQVEGAFSPLASEFRVIPFSVFDTVEKDAWNRRTIDKQPTMNTFFQKGVGGAARQRLKRHGIDLNDQSVNQRLAADAFVKGYATEDLQNASNSVSSGAVRYFLELCPDWLAMMERTRTTFTKLPNGDLHRLEMFSAMGNGFTFELETLIFYALCKCVADEEGSTKPVSVYGDDIVIGKEISPRCRLILNAAGFSINSSKSFNEGNFYESCGRHYFCGVEVTPVFQKEDVCDLASAIRAFNRLYRWSVRCVSALSSYKVLEVGRILAFTRWPSYLRRPFIPIQPLWWDGDDGFFAAPECFVPDKHGTIRFDCLRKEVKRKRSHGGGMYANALRRMHFATRPWSEPFLNRPLRETQLDGFATYGEVEVTGTEEKYLRNTYKTCWQDGGPMNLPL